MKKFPPYTIGHGNKKSDEFVVLLKKYAIECLIDVRSYLIQNSIHISTKTI